MITIAHKGCNKLYLDKVVKLIAEKEGLEIVEIDTNSLMRTEITTKYIDESKTEQPPNINLERPMLFCTLCGAKLDNKPSFRRLKQLYKSIIAEKK